MSEIQTADLSSWSHADVGMSIGQGEQSVICVTHQSMLSSKREQVI